MSTLEIFSKDLPTISVDTETYGSIKKNSVWDDCDNPIRLSYLSWWESTTDNGNVYSVWDPNRPECHEDEIWQFNRAFYSNPDYIKLFWNARFDIPVLQKFGLQLRGPVIDCMLLARIVASDKSASLKHWSKLHLGVEYEEEDAIKKYTRKHKCSYGDVPYDIAAPYALLDAKCTFELWHLLKKRVVDLKQVEVAALEHKILRIVLDMEKNGMPVSRPRLQVLKQECSQQKERAMEAVAHHSGVSDLNPNSTLHISKVIYGEPVLDDNGDPVILGSRCKYSIRQPKRWTPGGKPKVDELTLLEMSKGDKFIQSLLRYRELAKAEGTYYEGLAERVDRTGVIHTSFNQLGARTGRFSSSGPNLQNLPRGGKDVTKRVREIFIAGEDYELFLPDYDQIELRLIAHFADEVSMIRAINSGLNLHAETTKDIFEIDTQDPEWKDRYFLGKTLNFAISYGAKARRFKETVYKQSEGKIKLTIDEARDCVRKWLKAHPSVALYLRRNEENAEACHFIRTHFNRYIPISSDFYAATDLFIQGTAADIMKQAMIRCYKLLEKKKSKMLLTVHDELGFRIHCEELFLKEKLIDSMEILKTFRVPLTVSAKQGPSWGAAKGIA